jgi:hypothetical protein
LSNNDWDVLDAFHMLIPKGIAISNGENLITDLYASPIVVTDIVKIVKDASYSGSGEANAPNNHTTATWQIDVNTDLVNRGVLRLTSDVEGAGWWRCGMKEDFHGGTIEVPISPITSDIKLGSGIHSGCDCWDASSEDWLIAGSGCVDNGCKYTFRVFAQHGQCDQGNTGVDDKLYTISFSRPDYFQKIGLQQPVTKKPSVVIRTGQNLNVAVGSFGADILQGRVCSRNFDLKKASCVAYGSYNGSLPNNFMTYNIHLNPNEEFLGGTVHFTRSDGYDLSDFNLLLDYP